MKKNFVVSVIRYKTKPIVGSVIVAGIVFFYLLPRHMKDPVI